MKKAKAYLNVLKFRVNAKLKRQVIRNYPVGAFIEPTSFCNLRCPACPTGMRLDLRPTVSIEEQLFKAAIDEVGDYLFQLYIFNWGEPLLHKRTPEMISYAKKKDIKITLSTNLSMTLTDDYIERLVLSGLDTLIVSLDGTTAESYAKYRRRGNFARVRENMARVAATKQRLGKTAPEITWQFLVFRHNEHEIDDAVRFHKSWGADRIAVGPAMMPQDRHNDGLEPSTIPKFNWYHADNSVQAKASQLLKSGRTCSWLYGMFVLNPGGNVSPCCAVASEKNDFGEYSGTSFLDAWNNPKFQQARRYFAKRKSDVTADTNALQPSTEDAHFIDGMAAGPAMDLAENEIICQKCPIPHMLDYTDPIIDNAALDLASAFGEHQSLRLKCRAVINYLLMGTPNWTAVWSKLKNVTRRRRGLRFRLGDEIDFARPSAARAIQTGWAETDSWGIWTIGRFADLLLRPNRDSSRPLLIRAYVQPFLAQAHRRIGVDVSAGGQAIGRWNFDLDASEADGPRWCEAIVPSTANKKPLQIGLAVDSPASPRMLGLSGDERELGVFLIKLQVAECA